VKSTPDKEEAENFWREIYGKEFQHNGGEHWIENHYQQNPNMEWSPVCDKDVAQTLRAALNWTAPGRGQMAKCWFKQLTATHKHIDAICNKFIEEDQIPEWLTSRVTFLIPKNENTENTKSYNL